MTDEFGNAHFFAYGVHWSDIQWDEQKKETTSIMVSIRKVNCTKRHGSLEENKIIPN